jgi:hypothetical protein
VAEVARLVDLQQLQKDLARASFLALRGEDWTVARRSFLEAGEGAFGRNHFLREDGARGSVESTPEILDLWPRLRAAMTDGAAGTWLSAELEITPQGRMQYTFNWDRRPWMNTRTEMLGPPEPGVGPSDRAWLEDFRLHPRSAERTPAWMAAIIAAGPGPEPAVPGPEVDARRMAHRFGALLSEAGWSDLGAAVLRHTLDELRRGGRIWSDPTDLPEGDPEIERLVQEVVRATMREQLDPMPSDGLRRLYLGALAAGLPPKASSGPPVLVGDPAAASEEVARATVVEVVAQLTEALIDRD